MKFRCPISPFVEPLIVSLLRSFAPPAAPAAHVSFSFSRLSSNNRAMLSCGMRLPLRDETVQIGRCRCCEELLAERLLAEHLRELREDLEVHVGGPVRHEQHEDDAHVLSVGRIERDRLAHAHERADRVLESLDAPVRDGDALPEAGRAELLPRKKAVEHFAPRDVVVVLEEQPHLLEHAFLARDVEIDEHVRLWQQLCYEIHGLRKMRGFGKWWRRGCYWSSWCFSVPS